MKAKNSQSRKRAKSALKNSVKNLTIDKDGRLLLEQLENAILLTQVRYRAVDYGTFVGGDLVDDEYGSITPFYKYPQYIVPQFPDMHREYGQGVNTGFFWHNEFVYILVLEPETSELNPIVFAKIPKDRFANLYSGIRFS